MFQLGLYKGGVKQPPGREPTRSFFEGATDGSLAATARLDEKAHIGWRCGLRHGLFFAFGAGLLVDLNQYLLHPLPARLPIAWFVAGLLETCLAGWFAARVLGAACRGVHARVAGVA